MKPIYLLLLLKLLLFSSICLANSVAELLSGNETPAGVVFEIVEGEDDALTWAIPMVKKQTELLRERFPGLAIAIVSHGYEQFLLQSENIDSHSTVHTEVRNLVEVQKVPVHICATHASWYDVYSDDFPEYVDSAPSGPAQINAYQALGYQLIRITDAE